MKSPDRRARARGGPQPPPSIRPTSPGRPAARAAGLAPACCPALAGERAALEPAFLSLFSGVPIEAVLRFLDGRAGGLDLIRVVTALPPRPFLRAAARLAVGRPATARAGETLDPPR